MDHMTKGRSPIKYRFCRGVAVVLTAAGLTGLLGACGSVPTLHRETEPVVTEATVPAETVLPDGNPDDVSCKGSYTQDTADGRTVVAQVDGEVLTLGMLNILYRLEINSFVPGEQMQGPDFSKPLETQLCEPPYENLSWQQYFLQKALDRWHSLQALERMSLEVKLQDEENFEVDEALHEEYMKDMPINDTVLYGKEATFKLSKTQREYLDSLPEQLQALAKDRGGSLEQLVETQFGTMSSAEDLEKVTWLLNYAYMYFIELTYDREIDETALVTQIDQMEYTGETVVDMRHILFRPEGSWTPDGRVTASEEAWKKAEQDARKIRDRFVHGWRKVPGEFGVLAHDYTADESSRAFGGRYTEIHRGQMLEPLDQWLFDPQRSSGEVEVIRTDLGWHVVYFEDSRDIRVSEARNICLGALLQQDVKAAKANYPMEKTAYGDIALVEIYGQGELTAEKDLLYPDIAHERFPEVPVYIQQDYKQAPYGGYKVSSHGCGISAMAMLSTYMTDQVLTPGGLAARYGSYNSKSGTDQMIWMRVPPELGYFTLKKTGSWSEVEAALKEGKMAVSLQVKGYFTRGGHYLVISELLDNGNVVLRDSNLYNYKRLPEHAHDEFDPKLLLPNCQGFWIFDHKPVRTPACIRCGEADKSTSLFPEQDYVCERCRTAVARRNMFLSIVDEK